MDELGGRAHTGMPYGEIPYDALLQKMEETRGGLSEGHDESKHRSYIRSEIIDWAPDAPFMESDAPRRNPGRSSGRLNLQYNGTRGSTAELPQHPEMFWGFMGNDPRGVDNQPRLDEYRKHNDHRAGVLTTRMGDNDDYHLAERPWTAQSISYGMKEMHNRAKDSLKIFTVQKTGHAPGRNVSAPSQEMRSAMKRMPGESTEEAPDRPDSEGMTRYVAGGPPKPAPWHLSTGGMNLGVQQWGRASGAGLRGQTRRAPQSEGGHSWARAAEAARPKRTLGAVMARAAHAVRTTTQDQNPAPTVGPTVGRMTTGPSRGRVPDQTVEDQDRRPEGTLQDGDGELRSQKTAVASADVGMAWREATEDRLGPERPEDEAAAAAGGIMPQRGPRRTGEAVLTLNAHLTNVGAVAAGLKAGSRSALRKVAGMVEEDRQQRMTLVGMAPAGFGRPTNSADRVSNVALVNPQFKSNEGLEVHNYAAPARAARESRVNASTDTPEAWGESRIIAHQGKTGTVGQWRSASQADSSHEETMFGAALEGGGPGATGGAPSTRLLRPTSESNDTTLGGELNAAH